MKLKLKHIIFALSILLLNTSCENFLDVRPKGDVLYKDLLTDQQGFENALYGVYATMRNDALYGRNLSYRTLDVMAQYFNSVNNKYVTPLKAFDYENSDVKASFNSIWSTMYTNISNNNAILKSLEQCSPADLVFYDLYKGEALGLRAYMHFDLLRIFTEQITRNPNADGIPYATDFSLIAPDILKAEDVYLHIIADLKEAEQLLNNPRLYQSNGYGNFLNDQQTHFNLQAVQATLARVYLTHGSDSDLDSAQLYAEKVIIAQKQTLTNKEKVVGNVAGILSQTETIFGIYFKEYYDNVNPELYQSTSMFSFDPRNDIERIYQKNQVGKDYRWDADFEKVNNSLRFKKLLDRYRKENQEASRPDWQIVGINLIRIPEMYYIAAEAALKKGDYDTALAYFNEVQTHRGLTALDERIPAGRLTLERINDDRYIEFIGEGQSFFNMKRNNQDIKNTIGETVPASNIIYVVKIPTEEFEYRK